MEIAHRQANIIAEMLQASVRDLTYNFAAALDREDKLKVQVAALEQKLSPKPEILSSGAVESPPRP